MLSLLLPLLAAMLPAATAIDLDVTSPDTIRTASSTIAHGLMSFYKNNQSDTDPTKIGTFPEPLYWWEAGAVWGGMIDYWYYTGDTSYNPTVTQGLLAQVGPDNNYMPPAYYSSLGNDDQAFWAMACLSAVEYNFPTPPGNSSTMWLDLAKAVFDSQVRRWDMTECNGGLQWQVFKANPGWNYKNSVSNGALFQISARLAQITGEQKYVDWCTKIWDWMSGVGLIDDRYNVFDGTTPSENCSEINRVAWSYNPSMLLYGTAVLYKHTNGDDLWAKRTTGLLTACSNSFFSPYPNATNIMYEFACEPHGTCNNDQYSFKAYLSRWMAKSSILAPQIKDTVSDLISTSAKAAAESCTGGDDGSTCGQKWYVGGYDGSFGVGQSLSALETVQALLLLQGDVASPQPNAEQPPGSPDTETPTASTTAKSVQTKAASSDAEGVQTKTAATGAHDVQTKAQGSAKTITKTITETAGCTPTTCAADGASDAGKSSSARRRRRDAHLLRHGVVSKEV